jgi:hypothetical protein
MSVVDDSLTANTADKTKSNKFIDKKKPAQFKHYKAIENDAKNKNKNNSLTGKYFNQSTPRLPKIPEARGADYE